MCAAARLADLPCQIETNVRRPLLLIPTSTPHSGWQAGIRFRLHSPVDATGLDGEVLTECAVPAAQGIKVADVASLSDQAWGSRTELSWSTAAPTICVDIMSPSSTAAEMADKTALYPASGAAEVWILDLAGRTGFYQAQSQVPVSAIVPAFPATPSLLRRARRGLVTQLHAIGAAPEIHLFICRSARAIWRTSSCC